MIVEKKTREERWKILTRRSRVIHLTEELQEYLATFPLSKLDSTAKSLMSIKTKSITLTSFDYELLQQLKSYYSTDSYIIDRVDMILLFKPRF